MTARLSGEILTADKYNGDIDAGPAGIVARAERTTSSSTTTTTGGVLRIDDVPLTSGRTYRVTTSPLNGDSSVGTDDVRAFIKFTADGSTPTTSSTTLPESVVGGDVNGGGGNSWIIPAIAHYQPTGGDELWSGLLCVQRSSGTGNAYIFADSTQRIQMVIEDLGVTVVDAGTDV
jgi:hypothetical protein